MLNDIEKTFDTAFYNANHNLLFIEKFYMKNFHINNGNDDIIELIKNTCEQLSVIAFCFSQLMCKTILFSENCYINKEKLQQIQTENFHLKSDKLFIEFLRKIEYNLCASLNNEQKSSIIKNDSISPNKRVQRKRKKNKDELSWTTSRRPSPKLSMNNNEKDYDNFENNLIYNLQQANKKHLNLFKYHSNHRYFYKTSVFHQFYKNFKETEFINYLRENNIQKQYEVMELKLKLINYKQLLLYLNNQLSGRIQQMQLLKCKFIDQQLLNELEFKIQLNQYKTITNLLNLNANNDDFGQDDCIVNLLCLKKYSSIVNDRRSYMLSNCIDKTIINNCNNNDFNEPNSRINNNKTLIEFKNFNKSFINIGKFRFILIDLDRNKNEQLDIEITGGKEFDLPILISKIHSDSSLKNLSLFFIGDIILSVNNIDFTDIKHDEAVDILRNLSGKCRFGVFSLNTDQKNGPTLNSCDYRMENDDQQKQKNRQLFIEYYRSIFNATIQSRLEFCSTNSSSSSSSSSSPPSSNGESENDDEFDGQISCLSIENDDNTMVELSRKMEKMSPIPGIAKLIR